MSVPELSDHALVLPNLDVKSVKTAPGVSHGEFIVLRLELEAVGNVALIVDGISAIVSHGTDPKRLIVLNPGRIFPARTFASRGRNSAEPQFLWIVWRTKSNRA